MHELQRECDYCHHDVLFLGTRRRQNISFSFRPATLPKLLTILIFFSSAIFLFSFFLTFFLYNFSSVSYNICTVYFILIGGILYIP